MNWPRILICVGIMALVTYIPRALPLALFKKKIESPFIRSFLAYVPYAVLAAMTFPEIFYSTAEPGLAPTVSSICAACAGLLCALLLCFKKKSLLTVAVGATAAALFVSVALRLCGVS